MLEASEETAFRTAAGAGAGQRIRWLFTQKSTACARFQRAVARSAGLTPNELRALLAIARSDAATPAQLQLRLGITSTSVGALLSRLEQAGACVRTDHPHDARSTVVELTAAGAELLQERFAPLTDRIDAVVDALPAHEQETIGRFLERVAAASALAAEEAEEGR